MGRFIEKFVKTVNAGQALDMRIALARGSARPQEGTLLTPITREGFRVKVKLGRAETSLPWTLADLTPGQFWKALLLRGKRIALDPLDRLDLALLLAEIGLHEAIQSVLEGLGPIDALPEEVRADAADVIRRLDPERAAAAEWAAIRDELKQHGHDPRALRRRVQAFENSHFGTDFYILVGGAPPADPGLITRDVLNAYMKNLGLPKPPK